MYRTSDPRFRRRLNEIGQTLEHANESAQSSLYIFGQTYVRPCFAAVGDCLCGCVEASCPSLSVRRHPHHHHHHHHPRRRGRAELSFDFYDDWDEEESEGLLGGWGNDEFDRLVTAGGAGYGTVAAEPSRRRSGMSYGVRAQQRRNTHDDPSLIPGTGGFWARMFGGKGAGLRYKPSAADLQDHPGARRLRRDMAEGENTIDERDEEPQQHSARDALHGRGRGRSGTNASHETSDSYSSRGDIFPSDEEDDAVPLDDEFAMVLERRSAHDAESSSQRTGIAGVRKERRRSSKRPSAGSRSSTGRRTVSSRSVQSQAGARRPLPRSRSDADSIPPAPDLLEVKHDEHGIAEEAIYSSKEATPPETASPVLDAQDVQMLDEDAMREAPGHVDSLRIRDADDKDPAS